MAVWPRGRKLNVGQLMLVAALNTSLVGVYALLLDKPKPMHS